jgi:hypothetical protein
MLDHVLGYTPGTAALPALQSSSLEGREILVDLINLFLDVVGIAFEIDGHGCGAPSHCAFRCAQKSSKA